jgi:pimeloyl-ACP methyl ester carboxylesterase
MVLLLFCVGLVACGAFIKRLPAGEVPSPTALDKFIKVGNVRYHYLEYPGTGENVLLLHGFGSSTYTWEAVAPYLNKQGYHVWAVDMKGFGWSDKPKNETYDPISLADGVNRWMEAVGLTRVAFVGNSLGGAVGLLTLLNHPDKVQRLVLIDAAAYPQKLPKIISLSRVSPLVSLLKVFNGPWLIRWNLDEVFYDRDLVTKERVTAYFDRLRTENGLDAQVAVARTLNPDAFERFQKRIPEVNVPTLLIWGRDDRWVPLSIGQRFRKDIPGSVLVVLSRCGHIPQEERPEITARLVADFVAGKPVSDQTM